MEDMDMRQTLLTELIDKMHSRLADKMFPMPDVSKASEPAAAEPAPAVSETATAANDLAEKPDIGMHGDMAGSSTGIPDEDGMTDDELEEMMKGMDK
jgi:hypothetical protein